MRNPLSTALWSAELLARLTPEDRAGPRGEKLSNMCLRALQRLRLLVEDHFLAERLEVGGIPFKMEPIKVKDALDQATAKAGAGWSVSMDEAVAVMGDRALVERSLEALMAVAGTGQTPVRVEAARSGASVEIRVHGAKPAPDALERPHKGTPSDPTGRALSLHMTREVANALGGALALHGDGYLLTLPAADEGPTP
jgi:K+-sensing histidine kinase KdpD